MDIRRFFVSSKPPAQKPSQDGTLNTAEESTNRKKKKKSVSTDEEMKKKKTATKITSPKVEMEEEKKKKDSDKKRKKRAVIESDSEEEVVEQKQKAQKPDPPLPPAPLPPAKKDPVQYVSETDSDIDNFLSLKKSAKPQGNGVTKPGKDRTGTKERHRPPPKPTPAPATGKGGAKKSPPAPVTPKSALPQTKRTPTSVLDYFGSGSVQRSDKKLVASTKRKADHDESLTDEVIAQQLQMDEDMELEKQVHEDEEFARTLAMLDQQPHAKKARKDSGEKLGSVDKNSANSSHSSATSQSQSNERDHNQDAIGPSPKKVPPLVKTSSKLAMMKKREEEEDGGGGKTNLSVKAPVSPKKESLTPSSTDRKSKPKTGSVTVVTTPTTLKTSPKKESTSPEDSEKKRGNSSAFRSFLNRDGPRALGSKHIPTGAENCLEGCVFVISGVLESMEREDAKSLIERYGGKVTGNVSKRTTYLVMGRDGGAAKTEKAEGFGTKILDEDGLLELIRSTPGKKSKYLIAAEAENKGFKSRTPDTKTSPRTPKRSPKYCFKTPSPSKPGSASGRGVRVGDSVTPPGRGTGSGVKRGLGLGGKSQSSSSSATPSFPSFAGEDFSLLWVDKYRPQNLKAVIGQQGDQSQANKLLRWLKNWHTHHAVGGAKPAGRGFGKFSSTDNGSSFKAALLSGPPGVGKTTTAALVCEELGYSYVEMNASCTRSKNSLKQVIAESLNNTSIKNFYTGSSQTVSNKHVLIMDEIDGMAGNEDRGGIQEMIGLIKQSRIPIICMCNDRNHQKIRSLANYCFDLRFQRPRLEQIKGAMMSIAFKEGLKVPPPALNEMILASNQDIRQVLHNLSMWSAKDKVMTYDRVKEDANNARKDMKLGPFDVCRKVFSKGEESGHMTLIDKSDLFFHDYSLAPLFVQENYIHVKPAAAGGDLKSHLVLLSKTADSICDGDLVDRQIRSNQTWSLLPTQAIYSSVLPGELMRGYMNTFPSFPSWLGKFSSCNKHSRIIQELASHMSLKTLSSRQAVSLDYLPYLRMALLCPLQRQGAEGAGQAVQLLDDYHLVREDVDSLMEISLWGGQPDPYAKLDPKVKSAFTRAYNRETHLTPYSLQPIKKGRRGGGVEAELGGEGQEEQPEEEEEEGVAADAMIKQKKAKPSKEPKKEKTTAGDSGKGKGKGKGKARK